MQWRNEELRKASRASVIGFNIIKIYEFFTKISNHTQLQVNNAMIRVAYFNPEYPS